MSVVTNLVTNPTAGTNATGWSAGANRTVAQETSLPGAMPDGLATSVTTGFVCTAQATFGSGADITSSANLTLAAGPYVYATYLWIPTAWTGGQIAAQLADFAGATGTSSVNANMSLRDEWQRVVVSLTLAAGDVVGRTVVRCTAAPGYIDTQGIWVAAHILTAGTQVYPYFDGSLPDTPDIDYEWTGTEHASTSTRTTHWTGTHRKVRSQFELRPSY